jgi:acyl-CoA reductase-like NAD-dependent aldehyde dehydrogenase
MQQYASKIAGVAVDGQATAAVVNPFDGSTVGTVGVASEADVDAAIAAACTAATPLRRASTHERAEILTRIAAGLRERGTDIAALIAAESGKPIRYARSEVARAVTTFTLAAAEVRTQTGDVLPVDQQPGYEGRLCLARRVPRGPVLAIAPFNFPLNLVAHKLAPALAVGAPVVLKPAAQAPLTAHVLSDVVDAAGAPAGTFNVVHCPPELGEKLVRDERLKVLSFTGSDSLGWRLKSMAGKKAVVLELGGNAPCVVDAGVDLEVVVPRIAEAAWANAGQICIKAQRLFVHAELWETFLDRFVAASLTVPVGDPRDEQTVVGPLIERRHVDRVLDWIAEAKAAGARVLCGARGDGQLVWPTVLTQTTPDMRVRSLEVFGPVTVVERADDFEHALSLANEGRYGLQASVFTPSLAHAMAAYDRLDYGAVLINDAPTFRADNYPYGGTRDSGIGREGVRAAMEELTENKVLVLRAE